MGRRQLPEFKSQRALIRFLDDPKIDLSLFDLGTIGDPTDLEIDKNALELQEHAEYGKGGNLRPVTMRLDENLIRALKHIATRKGISYQALARMWLRESAIEELRWVSNLTRSKRTKLKPRRQVPVSR